MKSRIEKLRQLINHHNRLYYVLKVPELSDQQYNSMFKKLVELENEYPEYAHPNSPTQRVGSDLANKFPRRKHPLPMYSLEIFYEEGKLLHQLKEVTDSNPLYIFPKYDGVPIELIYNNGQLTHALTIGNGYVGSDVTANARTIKQIPLELPSGKCEQNFDSLTLIRGEVFVTHDELNRLNEKRNIREKEPYSNCRNAAKSLIKAKTSSQAANAKLSAVFFYVEFVKKNISKSISNRLSTPEQFTFLKNWQLPTPEHYIVCKSSEVPDFAAKIAAANNKFPTNGIVIKAYHPINYNSKSHAEPGTWAYLTDNPIWETTNRFISYSVNKEGEITAFSHFMSIKHNGTEFAKALITPQQAAQLKPRQTIHVQLSGGIIPKVIKTEVRSQKSEPVADSNCTPANENEIHSGIGEDLSVCPLCHQPLQSGRCTNTTYCPAYGHTAEIIKQHTGWQYEFPVFEHFDGYGIYIAATQGHKAIVVQREPRKNEMVLIADTLDTIALVGITIGQLEPGPFTYDDEY